MSQKKLNKSYKLRFYFPTHLLLCVIVERLRKIAFLIFIQQSSKASQNKFWEKGVWKSAFHGMGSKKEVKRGGQRRGSGNGRFLFVKLIKEPRFEINRRVWDTFMETSFPLDFLPIPLFTKLCKTSKSKSSTAFVLDSVDERHIRICFPKIFPNYTGAIKSSQQHNKNPNIL